MYVVYLSIINTHIKMEELKKELLRLQGLEKQFKGAYEDYMFFNDDNKLRELFHKLDN